MANFNVQYTKQARKMGNLFYRVGTIIMDNHPSHVKCLEVISSEKTGAEDSLYFSDLDVSLLFMINLEEFNWMANDPEKLDTLVRAFMKDLPKDRLMTGQYLGLADGQRMSFQPKGKVETLDNEKIKYAFYNIPYGIKEWEKVEKLWVMYNARLKSLLPAIDMNEAINVFLDEEIGKKEVGRFSPDFKLMEMTGLQFAGLLHSYYQMGIPKLACRSSRGNKVIEIKELLGRDEVLSGAELQKNMIRFLQTIRSVHIEEENYKKTANLWWTKLCSNIMNDVFVVPFNYEGEDYTKPVEDKTIHIFPNTHIQEIKYNDREELIIVCDGEEKVISCSQGFTPCETPDLRKMHIRTSYNPTLKEEWLGVFTDMDEYDRVWKGAAHVGLATFADFAQKYAPAKGIVINPANECFFLDERTINQLVNLKK